MKNIKADSTNQQTPVFKEGDWVKLTRSHGKDLPVGSPATVSERLADPTDISRDAYIVTFARDWDIIEVQALAPSSPHPFAYTSNSLGTPALASSADTRPPLAALKRTVEQEQNLLGAGIHKKQKTASKKKLPQPY